MNYLMKNHFKLLSDELDSNCVYGDNKGEIFYYPFCADGSDSFNGVYSGSLS